MIVGIIVAIFFFGLMVGIHEFGHFSAARLFGVTVHEFSIGMGPKLCSWGKSETRYSLRLLPIGGFVRMEGETESSEAPGSLSQKPAWQRLIVLSSGALMNLLLGFLIFVFMNAALGASTNEITEVLPETPAKEVGIMAGDRIVRAEKSVIHNVSDFRFSLYDLEKDEISVTVERDGERKEFSLVPKETDGVRQIGVVFGYDEKPYVWNVFRYAWYDTVFVVKNVVYSLGKLLTGAVGMESVSGPVGIVSTIGAAANQPSLWASILQVLELMAIITVNLGVFNMLPFPGLDGGHAVFTLLEMVRRKPVKPEHEGYVHAIGFLLLLLLMILVTWSDISKLIHT